MVQVGQIVSLEDIFTQGLKINEPEIVDVLLPGLKQEVLGIGFVQKQTDAGEKSRFKAIVAVGNGTGFLGVGGAKMRQVRSAIDKATLQAKLNVVPIRRGCGSWECGCGQAHSIPFRVRGKCGSVGIEILPGPRGLGPSRRRNSKNYPHVSRREGLLDQELRVNQHIRFNGIRCLRSAA